MSICLHQYRQTAKSSQVLYSTILNLSTDYDKQCHPAEGLDWPKLAKKSAIMIGETFAEKRRLIICRAMTGDREKFLLFRIYRNKDQKAFDELYDAFAPRVRRFLSFKLPTPSDVDEMTSEVFVRAWEYMQATRVENLGGLLYGIARNTVANFYRTRERRPVEVEIQAAQLLSNTGAEELVNEVSQELSLESIEKLLPRLKDDYREVIIMRYLDEMTIREIAEILEKSEASVRMLVHRAMVVIRAMIDKKESPYDHQS